MGRGGGGGADKTHCLTANNNMALLAQDLKIKQTEISSVIREKIERMMKMC